MKILCIFCVVSLAIGLIGNWVLDINFGGQGPVAFAIGVSWKTGMILLPIILIMALIDYARRK